MRGKECVFDFYSYYDVYVFVYDDRHPEHIKKYGKNSFEIIIDEDEINENIIPKALDRLNEVLELRDEKFRFKFDHDLFKKARESGS